MKKRGGLAPGTTRSSREGSGSDQVRTAETELFLFLLVASLLTRVVRSARTMADAAEPEGDTPKLELELGSEEEPVVGDAATHRDAAEPGDDQEEDDEDEDEDDDEDGPDAGGRKRGRDDLSRFFDLEAEAGDDDEEEEGDAEEGLADAIAEAEAAKDGGGGANQRLLNFTREADQLRGAMGWRRLCAEVLTLRGQAQRAGH